tara:strand:- start:1244 stop:1732 length:489 start_codon:yes stop_codon:yes gene_type:complete
MKKIILTLIITIFSTATFADGHGSGKIKLEGFGSWAVNALNAGKGDLAITYDGIASMKDLNEDPVFNNSSIQCVGGLTTKEAKFEDETGICRFDLIDGESVFIKYTGKGTSGVDGSGTFEFIRGTGKYENIKGKGNSGRINLKTKKKGFASTFNTFTGEYKY